MNREVTLMLSTAVLTQFKIIASCLCHSVLEAISGSVFRPPFNQSVQTDPVEITIC